VSTTGETVRGVDAFAVLGLPYSPELTDADVRAAYLLRLRAVHPDSSSGGDSTAEAAAAVTAAYDALRSGVRRGELLAAVTVDREFAPVAGDRGRQPAGLAADSITPASRAAQGLPPYVTDQATLAVIADRLVVLLGRGAGGRVAHPRPVSAAGPRRAEDRPPVFQPSTWRRAGRRAYAADRAWPEPVLVTGPWLVRGWLRVRYGRPGWLAARVLLAGLVVVVAQVVAAGDPAVWALGVGAVTWLVRTGRWDLAPRARR
jgi:hypothetical protein